MLVRVGLAVAAVECARLEINELSTLTASA